MRVIGDPKSSGPFFRSVDPVQKWATSYHISNMDSEYLKQETWLQLATKHHDEIERWTIPFRTRRGDGLSHPVHDFLFVYYRYSTCKLEKWHPGVGRVLEFDHRFTNPFDEKEYTTTDSSIFCDPKTMAPKVQRRLQWIVSLLKATQSRKPHFSCHGMHEWAMVYQGEDVRHESTTKFRLSQHEIDQVVESRPIACTHFDAFRFFADSAVALNRLNPTLETRHENEQPACIHANMDLYKWAFKSMPWIGSELLAKCFHFAMKCRSVDMRASPYDLSEYDNFEPILIETAEGRSLYEQLQKELADEAMPLREQLIAKIEYVLMQV